MGQLLSLNTIYKFNYFATYLRRVPAHLVDDLADDFGRLSSPQKLGFVPADHKNSIAWRLFIVQLLLSECLKNVLDIKSEFH